MSMLTYFSRQMTDQDYPEGALYALNYGCDRVRMMSPVPVGCRIRCSGRLLDVTNRGDERYLVKLEYRIEVEGQEKPALIAEWLCLFAFPQNQ
jgi:acyl dehydratase